MALRASQLLTRHASLLPRRLPCSPRCCCSSSFDEWLKLNALPSRHLQHRGSGSTSDAAADLPTVRRFHVSQAPALAAACLQRYGSSHLWTLEAHGVLLISDSGSGPAARLELPRVLEGAHPALFAPAQQGASPLPVSPAAEQRRLLDALAALAAGAGQGGEALDPTAEPAPACGSGLLGQQLLVLLSADSAALAMYSGGALSRHKVLTGYTVRRQQGKAQAAYQRQGGGAPLSTCVGRRGWGRPAAWLPWGCSRVCPTALHRLSCLLPATSRALAGARSVGGSMRARETRRLFQAAAATLAAWAPDLDACSLLFRSGTGGERQRSAQDWRPAVRA